MLRTHLVAAKTVNTVLIVNLCLSILQGYSVLGAALGGLCGALLTLNTEGLDFVMTAMFVVIFLENWLKEENHTSSLLGLALPLVCLVLFGAQSFILPSMAAILLALTALRGRLEKGGDPA